MKVAVIGVGQTKFGELWSKSLKNLAAEAATASIKDAGINAKDINTIFVGNMAAGRFAGQEHVGAVVADAMNMKVPAMRCEGACASGALAFSAARSSVMAGDSEVSLVVGVEKMNDLGAPEATEALMGAGDHEWEGSIGLTFPGLYALIARAHMHQYGTTKEQMGLVSVNNHRNGSKNKYAQFASEITLNDVMKSPMIADPLGLLDCSPITDGSAALIIASESYVKKNKIEKPVWLAGYGMGNDTVALHDRASLTEMAAVKSAAGAAYKKAGMEPNDIDFAEVHDCFSINEILALEDLGFCAKGMGGRFVEDGQIKLDGEKPINTTGGLKSIGHPVGATGIRQISDVVKQLRGDSINQLKGAKCGLCLNVGGSGATAVVNIFKGDQ